ncbi:lytic transglycosylase domain-containing protein [Tissierellaceae bacterium BX21]|uniref:Lytic transglycosylase domain-containing protein n=2 Tax=Paratissierella segnis TaxID=2763679 RepID=A0A926IKT8_9FIRM|nr:lytic transglycosylase domain-containing protein [Paratissierella segnis]
MFYPVGYKNIVNKYSKEYGVDPYLVLSMINVESKYNKDAVSNKNARGLMQIGPQTGLWAAESLKIDNYSESLLFEPEINILIGVWYIDQLKKEFGDRSDLVLAAYNAGSGNVNKWLSDDNYSKDGDLTNIPFNETDEYVTKVKKNHRVYKLLYKSYMAKPDTFSSIYIDGIINLRNILIKVLKSFR